MTRLNITRLIVSLVFASCLAHAQGLTLPNDPTRADLNSLTQEGKLFSVELVPRKNIEIRVVGHPAADYNFNTGHVKAKMLKPVAKNLHVARDHDHYTITDKIPAGEPVELEVQPDSKGKTETFHFTIQNQPR